MQNTPKVKSFFSLQNNTLKKSKNKNKNKKKMRKGFLEKKKKKIIQIFPSFFVTQ